METKADMLNRLRPQSAGVSGAEEKEQLNLYTCTICNMHLNSNSIAQHTADEMECLRQMQLRTDAAALQNGNASDVLAGAEEQRKPWTVFQKVKKNRQSRLKRTRRRPAPPPQPPAEQPICPICNLSFPTDEIQRHAERCCLRGTTTNGRSGDHSSDDDENAGGEMIEEYEWAGQKRIRVSSMLQGGYAALGIGQTISNRNNGSQPADDDEDEDLNVDEDDTHIYGPTQYAESDVIAASIEGGGCGDDVSGDNDVTMYMRRLITAHDPRPVDATTTAVASSNDATPTGASATTDIPLKTENETETGLATGQQQQIIESLKMKLRNYEQQDPVQSKYKCLICLDNYLNPAISVACWHVHCEQCWLRSLSARKLCPQCNLITTPKDLRRIYM